MTARGPGPVTTVSVTGDGRAALAMVRYGPAAVPPDPAELFSDGELTDLIGNPAAASWAGKLAAKVAVGAVLRLAEPRLPEIEILPDRRGCPAGPACRGRHRPAVGLSGAARDALAALGTRIELSISHESTAAVAVAMLEP